MGLAKFLSNFMSLTVSFFLVFVCFAVYSVLFHKAVLQSFLEIFCKVKTLEVLVLQLNKSKCLGLWKKNTGLVTSSSLTFIIHHPRYHDQIYNHQIHCHKIICFSESTTETIKQWVRWPEERDILKGGWNQL